MYLKRCKKSELIEYIKIYWNNDKDRDCISEYSKQNGKQIGTGLGYYSDNGILVGFIFYNFNKYLPTYKKRNHLLKETNLPIGEINLLEVHPKYRQQGIGSKLVQEVIKRMHSQSYMIVNSWKTDEHFKFYTKNGFEYNKEDSNEYRHSFIKYKY
jgi:ribosomal protein S18 acetylase RimI-like enzyme